MIDNVIDYGYCSEKEPKMGYGIKITWHNEQQDSVETFSGSDVNEVLVNAMRFIIKHHKEITPTT